MKTTTRLLAALAMVFAGAPVMAAGTATVYKSGVLVLAFLGFLALMVVVQVIPSVLMAVGMLAGVLKRARTAPATMPVAKEDA